MTKNEAYNLKEGENLYKFTDEEIQMICNALNCMCIDMQSIATSLNNKVMYKDVSGLTAEADKADDLKYSIENKEHSL